MSSDQTAYQQQQAAAAGRTTSFGSLIKRTRSSDLLGERKASSSGRLRKKSIESESRPSINETPPALPTVAPQPVIESFGGEDYIPRTSMSPSSNGVRGAPPMPPIPRSYDQAVDPYARTESMTHRSRYSYAHSTTSSAVNSPRRVRRRKDPTPYK